MDAVDVFPAMSFAVAVIVFAPGTIETPIASNFPFATNAVIPERGQSRVSYPSHEDASPWPPRLIT